MQAVILSGGEGKRLRPLTSTVPKPSVPLVNRPMILYMIEWLAGHGVNKIVMSCGFMAIGLRAALEEYSPAGVHIDYFEEPVPLGTAGAVKHAEGVLEERFLVLNGDVLCDFDVSKEIEQHERTGAVATIALQPVEDPSAYGLVLTGPGNAVEAFLEKDQQDSENLPANPRINAGCYVLEREVLNLVAPARMQSFEHDVFPQLVGKGLYAFDATGYWLDVGTPDRYMQATRDLLDRNVDSWVAERLASGGRAIEGGVHTGGAQIVPPVVIDDNCTIGDGARIGPYAVLGHGCAVGDGAVIENAVVQRGATIGEHAEISGEAIVAPGVLIGNDVCVCEGSVVGEGARIGAGNRIVGHSRIEAGIDIPANTVGV
jgi:mannose-1-phosphate guanylyltransferase